MAALPPEVRELFEGANFAHLATLMPDGSPHSVAVWAGLEGDNVVFFTQVGSLKARNLARDPRVAISITDHDDPYQTAQLRGEVVEVRGAEAAHALSDALALRYTGEPFPFRPPTARAYVVEVHRVRSTQLGFEHRPEPA
jgi:PPOX class probable F420-dependent enzyme